MCGWEPFLENSEWLGAFLRRFVLVASVFFDTSTTLSLPFLTPSCMGTRKGQNVFLTSRWKSSVPNPSKFLVSEKGESLAMSSLRPQILRFDEICRSGLKKLLLSVLYAKPVATKPLPVTTISILESVFPFAHAPEYEFVSFNPTLNARFTDKNVRLACAYKVEATDNSMKSEFRTNLLKKKQTSLFK